MQVFVWFEVASKVCDGRRIDHGDEEITSLFYRNSRLTLMLVLPQERFGVGRTATPLAPASM